VRNPLLRNLLLKGKLFLDSGDTAEVKFFFGDGIYVGRGGGPEAWLKAWHPPATSAENGWLLDARRQTNWQNFFFGSCLVLTYYRTLL